MQYLRTGSTAEQPAIGPPQSSIVHTAVRSCLPDSRVRQRKPASTTKCLAESNNTIDIFKADDRPVYLDLNRIEPYRLLNVKKVGNFFRPNDQRKVWIFPKYALGHLLAQVHV